MLDHLSVDNCFALLFTVRTGSHLCKSALHSHPDIRKWYVERQTNNPILFGGELITPQPYLTGLKMNIELLCEMGRLHEVWCPKIATYRHNKLSQLISYFLARDQDNWRDRPYNDVKINISIDDGIRWINSWTDSEEAARTAFGSECLWVEYGELVSGKAFDKMLKHLGLPIVELKPYHKKQAQKPNIEYVENVDELLASDLAGWV